MIYLEKLKYSPKNNLLIAVTTFTGILFVFLAYFTYKPNVTNVNVYNLTHLESAWTKAQVSIIFSTWEPEHMIQMISVIIFDFFYIGSYVLFLFGVILIEARKLHGVSQNVGLIITLAPIIAGIFNIIENLNLLLMLYNVYTFPPFIPFITSFCSTIKWIFLVMAIVIFLILLTPFIFKFILGF